MLQQFGRNRVVWAVLLVAAGLLLVILSLGNLFAQSPESPSLDGQEAASASHAGALLAASQVPQQGLVAYWPFDEGRGEIAHDQTDFHNDGQVDGPSWVVGLVEFGLNYYGRRGLATKVPDDDSLDAREKLTVACWVCLNQQLARESEDEQFFLFAKPFEGAYSLSIERDKGRLLGAVSLAGKERTLQGEALVPYNRWVHVAFTYDYETGEARLYLDGEPDRIGQLGPGLIDVNAARLLLGSALDPSSSEPIGVVPGILDEARVYQRVLLPEEILRLASEPALAPERPCGNCYSPLSIGAYLAGLSDQAVITQEQFFRWLLMMLNSSSTLPIDAPIESILEYLGEISIIPGDFPLQLNAAISKGQAALLLVRALQLETPLLGQLLLSGAIQQAEELAFEIAFGEGLIPSGRAGDLLSGRELAWMTLVLLERLEVAPPAGFPEAASGCASLKRSYLETVLPPLLPPLPPSS